MIPYSIKLYSGKKRKKDKAETTKDIFFKTNDRISKNPAKYNNIIGNIPILQNIDTKKDDRNLHPEKNEHINQVKENIIIDLTKEEDEEVIYISEDETNNAYEEKNKTDTNEEFPINPEDFDISIEYEETVYNNDNNSDINMELIEDAPEVIKSEQNKQIKGSTQNNPIPYISNLPKESINSDDPPFKIDKNKDEYYVTTIEKNENFEIKKYIFPKDEMEVTYKFPIKGADNKINNDINLENIKYFIDKSIYKEHINESEKDYNDELKATINTLQPDKKSEDSHFRKILDTFKFFKDLINKNKNTLSEDIKEYNNKITHQKDKKNKINKNLIEVYHYGSFGQHIWTINSDIDMTIIYPIYYSNKEKKDKLLKLQNVLITEKFSNHIKQIGEKVPILRGICDKTGICFDISINNKKGYFARREIATIIQNHYCIKNYNIIIKSIMKSQNFIDVHNEYMSSFCLFHLIYAYYIYLKQNVNEFDEDNIYYFILNFFNFYGKNFNESKQYISFDKINGNPFKKKPVTKDQLTVYCLFDEKNNVANKCKKYFLIKNYYSKIYDTLIKNKDKKKKIVELLKICELDSVKNSENNNAKNDVTNNI